MDNNQILKKLRIALQLRDDEIVKVFALADWDMTKNQVNALFQNPDNKNFELCSEQTLRKFLDGLIPYKRGPKPDFKAKPKLKRKETFQKIVPEKRPPAQKDEA